jgi:hypothetical protein
VQTIIEISLPKYDEDKKSSSKNQRDYFYSVHTDSRGAKWWLDDQWPEDYATLVKDFFIEAIQIGRRSCP